MITSPFIPLLCPNKTEHIFDFRWLYLSMQEQCFFLIRAALYWKGGTKMKKTAELLPLKMYPFIFYECETVNQLARKEMYRFLYSLKKKGHFIFKFNNSNCRFDFALTLIACHHNQIFINDCLAKST